MAGGSGARMKSGIPKQFMTVGGKPVLMYSIEAFSLAVPTIQILVVLPAGQILAWQSLTGKYHLKTPYRILEGGKERFHSVKKGLEHIPDHVLVAIHDGVRPVIRPSLIIRCFRHAQEFGSAIPCIPLKESAREVDGTNHFPVPRDSIRIVQTPQVFRSEWIKQAYQQPFHVRFTDDATVLESIGRPVHLVDGDHLNIKVTYPEDLVVAEVLLKEPSAGRRQSGIETSD